MQLVFATPEFDGLPRETVGDAWSIAVHAEDTASPDDGTMLSSPPSVCGLGQEGMFYWDDDAATLCVCDGSDWAPIDSDNMASCA